MSLPNPGIFSYRAILGGKLPHIMRYEDRCRGRRLVSRLVRHYCGDGLFILVAPCFHQTTMLPWKKALRY